MARHKKKKPDRKKDRARNKEFKCPLEYKAPPTKKSPKKPLIERTETRGLVELKFPGFEATFPGTNRSVMVIIVSLFLALVIIIPVCFYQVFSASPEALETVGSIFGSDDKPREPVQMPVKTDNGIEIIEVCPPCTDWTPEQCEERYGEYQECPVCQDCPVCQVCPPPPPPAMLPQKGEEPLL